MRRYARFVIPAVVIIGVLGFLAVILSESLVYYNTPAELQARDASDATFKLAGRVVPGSVVEGDTTVAFTVEDCDTTVPVVHTGTPPQLFQPGIMIVVEGIWDGSTFDSDTMLIKHDEQYRTDAEDYDQTDHSCTDS